MSLTCFFNDHIRSVLLGFFAYHFTVVITTTPSRFQSPNAMKKRPRVGRLALLLLMMALTTMTKIDFVSLRKTMVPVLSNSNLETRTRESESSSRVDREA